MRTLYRAGQLVRGLERAAVGERRDANGRMHVLPQRRSGREPVIAGTFPLADAAKAHERGDTQHVAGKLVLTMS